MNKQQQLDKYILKNQRKITKRFDMTPRGMCFYEYVLSIVEGHEDDNETYAAEFEKMVELMSQEWSLRFKPVPVSDMRKLVAEMYCELWKGCYEKMRSK